MNRKPNRAASTTYDDCNLDAIQEEVQDLKNRLDGIEARYRAVKEAEERWRDFMRERDCLVFINGAGEIAKIPQHLALLIGKDRSYDGEIEESGSNLQFIQQDNTVATVPKSLLKQLKGLLLRGKV